MFRTSNCTSSVGLYKQLAVSHRASKGASSLWQDTDVQNTYWWWAISCSKHVEDKLSKINYSYDKTNKMHYFSIFFFGNKSLHVSDSSSVHHQEFSSLYTQQWYMSHRFAESLRAGSGRTWWWTEELSETYRVLFPKNKFEKLVHLVGFITRIYHDARSHEREINYFENVCMLLFFLTHVCHDVWLR